MNAVAPIANSSELVASIEAARAMLDAGDVDRAYTVASIAYDQAKAAGISAERVKASGELVDKARRMQAEALKIESLCLIAMADTVDEAQSTGRMLRNGRPSKSASFDGLRLSDVGISRQRLHAARKIRDGVRADPGLIERVVSARLSLGLEPSRRWLRNSIASGVPQKAADRAVYTLCTGEKIADISWSRLGSIAARYRRELAVIDRIRNHCVPADADASVRHVLGPELLSSLIAGGGDE